MTGASGFVHVANDMLHSAEASIAVERAVDTALNALEACAKQSSMKRFVYASSSFAATQPKPDVDFRTATDAYNDEAVARNQEPGADGETVYSASKAEADRAIYRWVKENKPSLVVNSSMEHSQSKTMSRLLADS